MSVEEIIYLGFDRNEENANLPLFIQSDLSDVIIVSPYGQEGITNSGRTLDVQFVGYVFIFRKNYSRQLLIEYHNAVKQSRKKGQFVICVLIGSFSPQPDLEHVTLLRLEENGDHENKIARIIRNVLADRDSDQALFGNSEIIQNLWMDLQGIAEKQDGFYSLTDLQKETMKRFREGIGLHPELLNDELNNAVYESIIPFLENLYDDDGTHGYYLLKLNPGTWIINELKLGENARFHTHDLQNQRRQEYDLYLNLKKGDKVLGFAFYEYMAVVCEFVVTEEIRNDEKLGEGIGIKVTRLLNPIIQLNQFKNEIDFSSRLDNIAHERLFKIDYLTYHKILNSSSRRRITADWDKESGYTNDKDSSADHLDFQNDIDSFALIITLEKVKPPLAIGLFGEWGAGKSFFMEYLRMKIQELSKSTDNRFLKNVVHVEFNAWHYSDSNLWASLITHIFEKLNDFAQDKKFDEESVKAMYARLALTTIEISETQSDLESTEVILKSLTGEKQNLEDTIQTKKNNLSMLTAGDIFGVVVNEPSIKAGLQKIVELDPSRKTLADLNDVDSRLSEVSSGWKRVKEAFQLFKDVKGAWLKIILFFIFMIVLVSLVALPPFQNAIMVLVTRLGSIVAGFLAFLKGFDWLRPYLSKLNELYHRLKTVREAAQVRADQLKYNESLEIQRMEIDIALMSDKRNALNIVLNEKQHEETALRDQLNQIGSGKRITSFISGKSADAVYSSELGIISRIRKDFEQLNSLFIQQKSVKEETVAGKERFQIDRIVLYIDDLDRCNSSIVVKTLEAVHLLLGLELFVVVVGVDSHWLNSSISNQFNNLSYDQGNPSENLPQYGSVTTYDYLEKIFQIPFTLKPMSEIGRIKLIRALTSKDVIEEVEREESPNRVAIAEEEGRLLTDENGILLVTERNDLEIEERNLLVEDELFVVIEQRVTLTNEEVKTMESLAMLFGHTPRTIKRYVNIYRIIKAHKSFSTSEDPGRLDFVPTMLLLGIVTGCPKNAGKFMQLLKSTQVSTFIELIIQLEFADIKNALSMIGESRLEGITIDMLRENIELISRFTFRKCEQSNCNRS